MIKEWKNSFILTLFKTFKMYMGLIFYGTLMKVWISGCSFILTNAIAFFTYSEKNWTKNNKKERRIKKIIAKSDKIYYLYYSDKYCLLSKNISVDNESTKHKKEKKLKMSFVIVIKFWMKEKKNSSV